MAWAHFVRRCKENQLLIDRSRGSRAVVQVFFFGDDGLALGLGVWIYGLGLDWWLVGWE